MNSTRCYVARQARGTSLAAILTRDAEEQLLLRSTNKPWLCAIGTTRTTRFYEKAGWHRILMETVPSDTPDGPLLLDVWRFEKALAFGQECLASQRRCV